MDRRTYLSTATVALAGCLAADDRDDDQEASDQDGLALDGKVLEFQERYVHGGIAYKGFGVDLYETVEYYDSSTDELREYDGPVIANAVVNVDVLGDNPEPIPEYDQLTLTTDQQQHVEPVRELPGGIPIDDVETGALRATPRNFGSTSGPVLMAVYAIDPAEAVAIEMELDKMVSWRGSPTRMRVGL